MLPAVLHVSRQLSAMPFPAKLWKELLLLMVKVFTNMNCHREVVERVIRIPSQVEGSVNELFASPKVLNKQEKIEKYLQRLFLIYAILHVKVFPCEEIGTKNCK